MRIHSFKLYREKGMRLLAKHYREFRLKKLLRPLMEELRNRNLSESIKLLDNQKYQKHLKALDIDAKSLRDTLGLAVKSNEKIPVIVKPNNIRGYVTHYHHFFGGLVLPILEWCKLGALNSEDKLIIRDCGALNSEMEGWAKILGIKVHFIPPEVMPAIVKSGLFKVWEAPCYDHSYEADWIPRKDVIQGFRSYVFDKLGISVSSNAASEKTIVFVGRDFPPAFYKTRRADHSASGAERRSIPNQEEVISTLRENGFDVSLVFLEKMTIEKKVELFSRAAVVVGQMGAGLNNVIWMKTGGGLVEIIPVPEIRSCFAVFGNIAERVGVRHRRIIQSSNHSDVSPDLVVAMVRDLLVNNNG